MFVPNRTVSFMGIRRSFEPRNTRRLNLTVSSFCIFLVLLGICGLVGVGMLFVKNDRIETIRK